VIIPYFFVVIIEIFGWVFLGFWSVISVFWMGIFGPTTEVFWFWLVFGKTVFGAALQ